MDDAAISAWKEELCASGIPRHAEIRWDRDGDAIRFEADWETFDDPQRPHKRSRTLRIEISGDAVRAYRRLDVRGRQAADANFRRLAAVCVASFDPRRERAMGLVAEPHEFSIDRDDLLDVG